MSQPETASCVHSVPLVGRAWLRGDVETDRGLLLVQRSVVLR